MTYGRVSAIDSCFELEISLYINDPTHDDLSAYRRVSAIKPYLKQ